MEAYRGDEIPACRLCGGPLTVGSMGGGNATVYACADAGVGKDRTYDLDHYSASRYVHRRSGDSLAYQLLSFAAAVASPDVLGRGTDADGADSERERNS